MPLQYEQYAHLLHPEGHNAAVTAVNFSPSGRLLASAGLDGRVCVWQVSCGDLLYVFSGKSAVLSVVWVGSDTHLVCGMEDGTIAFLAILTTDGLTQELIKLDGFWAHRYPVEQFAYNGTLLASGAHKEVKVWLRSSKASWTIVADLPAPRRTSVTTACDIIATSLHWTSTSQYPSVLLVTYLNHGIAAYDGRTWTRIGGTSLPGRIADASLTRDGRILVISNMLTGFELFALKGLVELEPLFCFKQDVLGGPCLPVRFLHGDHAIIGGCVYGHVNLWDIYSRGKHVLNVGDEDTAVIAISAHYDDLRDDFFVATGVFNRDNASPVLLWKTREARDWRRTTRSEVRRPAPPLLGVWCKILVAYIWWSTLSVLVLGISLYLTGVSPWMWIM